MCGFYPWHDRWHGGRYGDYWFGWADSPHLLTEGSELHAVAVLQAYYRPITQTTGYTGGQFDTFDPSGTRAASANVFTSDDLIAVSTLSVDVPARAALQLLDTQRRHYTVLLEDLGPDRDLVEIPSADEQQFAPAWALWRALMSLDHIGPTTASKLIARKRPRLIPIFDDVINQHLLGGTGRLWVPLHRALQADERALHHRLLTIRDTAGLDQSVSAIRVLDVLTWMDGKGYAARLAGPNAHPPAQE